jgi:hypothetical protein
VLQAGAGVQRRQRLRRLCMLAVQSLCMPTFESRSRELACMYMQTCHMQPHPCHGGHWLQHYISRDEEHCGKRGGAAAVVQTNVRCKLILGACSGGRLGAAEEGLACAVCAGPGRGCEYSIMNLSGASEQAFGHHCVADHSS